MSTTLRPISSAAMLLLAIVPLVDGTASSSPSTDPHVEAGRTDSATAESLSPFVATYDLDAGGVRVGTMRLALVRSGPDEFLLTRDSDAVGWAKLLGPGRQSESSRFRVDADVLRAIEYRSERDGGDEEENAQLVFDGQAGRVRRLGPGRTWEVELDATTLDPLSLLLALVLDVARGDDELRYPVPHEGRIKIYSFERRGTTERRALGRAVPAVEVIRTNERTDHTTIWLAPELGGLPIEISKERPGKPDSRLRLRKLSREDAP